LGDLGTVAEFAFADFWCGIPGCADYKAVRLINFQNFRRALLFFSSVTFWNKPKGRPLVMCQDYSSVGPDHGQFDRTQWSMVLGAVQSRAPGAPQALAELCRRYWQPLYCFARRRGRSPEDSQDLVQGFFEHLIGSHGLGTVDRSKGKFRSFLLACFQNFMAAESRLARAEKRGGHSERIRLDWRDAENHLTFEPEDKLTPETLYDAQWALLLLRRAAERLQQEQAAMGKTEIFRTLKAFLGGDGSGPMSITYEEAARSLGIGTTAVTTLIHRLRQRHRELVREEVQRTVLNPADVAGELHGLCEALVRAEGRVRT
jgi:DNA-directed RNA polymerase specialized sigma24 family protein